MAIFSLYRYSYSALAFRVLLNQSIKRRSRSRPPEVDPVVIRGVRYGQHWSHLACWLSVTKKAGINYGPSDISWRASLETDVQTVYFKSVLVHINQNQLGKSGLDDGRDTFSIGAGIDYYNKK